MAGCCLTRVKFASGAGDVGFGTSAKMNVKSLFQFKDLRHDILLRCLRRTKLSSN